MAYSNFPTALEVTLNHEGGYVNHPRDPGGRTNLGVTQRTYEDWVGYKVTEKIMRSLTPAGVKTLYKVKYWDAVKGDDLPVGLDLCVFDFGVNAGPNRAKRYLQLLVGTKIDGVIGPKTMTALKTYISKVGLKEAILGYQDQRLSYHKKLRTWDVFGKGWTRRILEVEASALTMAENRKNKGR